MRAGSDYERDTSFDSELERKLDEELDWGLPHRRFGRLAEALGLTCVDLTDALAARPTAETYYSFDGH